MFAMETANARLVLISITLGLLLLSFPTSYAQRPHTLTGDIKFHAKFHSKVLNNDRDVVVYLPPDYTTETKRHYSVLYLHDGQNLFDGATSFIAGQEWRVDETAQALIESHRIEPIIVVGIYNAGNDRINEYTPVTDPRYKAGGRADLYGQFIIDELKPFIDKTYRTRVDASHTGLGGSSLGGLVSLYLGLKHPNVFGKLAVVSPSVWWDDKQIVKFVDALPKSKRPRIWLDIGTKEGRNEQEAQGSVADARSLRDALLKKGWRKGSSLQYLEAEGAMHNEQAWALRTDKILEFLFPN